jgi:uncharacterized membrane protein SpoIIM required for sporulation
VLRVEEFVARRQGDWTDLEDLLRRAAGRGLPGFSGTELERLGRLYRLASADLAVAQRDFPQDRVRAYLDQLLARAHPYVYQGDVAEWRGLVHFFTEGFPRLYRANAAYVLASAALFLLPGLIAYMATLNSAAAQEALVSPSLLSFVRQGQMWTDIPEQVRPAASTFLMTNNLQVSILAFAGGILAGLGTVYVLLQNGLMLGAVVGTCQAHGLALPLLAFVSPHGYLELSDIVIAGAAGLRLGYPLLAPGLFSRRRALAQGARVAVQLLAGGAPLLVLAGVLEAFVSPSDLPPEVKLALGASTGIVLYVYLLYAGRTSPLARRLSRRVGGVDRSTGVGRSTPRKINQDGLAMGDTP